MKDLVFFICFILIFLFGFSVTSWAFHISEYQVQWKYLEHGQLGNVTFTQYGKNESALRLLYDVTNFGIGKVFASIEPYGKTFLIPFNLTYHDRFCLTIEVKNLYTSLVFILNILFVTIANVLLLNVLIALFK